MTQSGYSNAIVSAMLSYLKGFANWVLRLFKLSKGTSPLTFLANNWFKLLVILLVIGLCVDLLVWLVRWRPHWVWFRKKRVVISDDNFFNGEERYDPDAELFEGLPRTQRLKPDRNWVDRDFTVRSETSAKLKRQRAEQAEQKAEEPVDVFKDDSFSVTAKKRHSDRYEDEVFNVSNLPRKGGERDAARRPQTKKRS